MATGVLDSPPAATERTTPTARPVWWRALRLAAIGAAIITVVSSTWWGPRLLAKLDYFHVRRVVFEGMRYTPRVEAMERLRLDTLQSVWQELDPLVSRLESHPLVEAATVERQLPGTILVRVVEREPVALVPRKGGALQPVDGAGRPLPIDPARVPLDVPLAGTRDSILMHLLDGLRVSEPALFARIERADRAGSELRFKLDAFVVLTNPDVTVSRFKDILPVEADLARNRLRAVELDLRFRHQVIARQP